ncbi:MAG: hypothetical protein JWR61_1004 [Ferruginibacter sp.]|nr:hypothetical protein [Ferruginibacter sp.]
MISIKIELILREVGIIYFSSTPTFSLLGQPFLLFTV